MESDRQTHGPTQMDELETLPPPKTRRGPFGTFYGWWVVAIAFSGQMLAGGFFNSGLSVYFLPLSRDLGVSRAAVSLAFTLKNLEGGLDGPVVGYFVDRLGARFMVRVGGVLAGLGFVLIAFTHDFAWFMLVFLCVLTLGFNLGIGLPLATAVNHWFVRNRALAITVAQVGAEFGGAVFTPLIALSVYELGWRPTAVWSGVMLLILIPLLAQFMRDTPESMGMLPNGISEPNQPIAPGAPLDHETKDSHADNEFVLGQALRTRAFWQLSLAIGARLFSKHALMIHLIPLLVWRGLDEPTAALLLGASMGLQVPLRTGAAWVADRWSMTRVAALAALCGVVSVVVLLNGEDGWIFIGVLFVVLFALAETGNSPAFAVIGDYFGRNSYGTIRGSVSFVQNVISLPSPVVAGWLYDTTQSYQLALIPIGVSYLIAFLLFWTVRPPAALARAGS